MRFHIRLIGSGVVIVKSKRHHSVTLNDRRALTELLGIKSFKRYQQVYKGWIENELNLA